MVNPQLNSLCVKTIAFRMTGIEIKGSNKSQDCYIESEY